jgi:bifunctional DNase/RNase
MNGTALSCLVAALALAAAEAPEPDEGLVEMEVAAVFPLEDAHAGVLVLREKGGEVLVPIVVGRSEAEAVQQRLRHERPPRPRAQELLADAIDALGGRVVRVEIHDASEALYRARVLLAKGAERVQLDARPSDSVALALGAGAPIFATRALVEGAGLTREDLDRLRAPPKEPDPVPPDEQRM